MQKCNLLPSSSFSSQQETSQHLGQRRIILTRSQLVQGTQNSVSHRFTEPLARVQPVRFVAGVQERPPSQVVQGKTLAPLEGAQ